MGQIGQLLTGSSKRVSGLAGGLLNGIDPKSASNMPKQDGQCIKCNHPVFVLGHLSIYPQMVIGMLGGEPSDAAVPEGYTELFSHGVECKDDSDSSIYPSLDEVAGHFNKAYEAFVSFAQELDDSVYAKDIEGSDGFKDAFGTNGVMVSFMLHDHVMFHLGQLSTWRRAMGLGSAM